MKKLFCLVILLASLSITGAMDVHLARADEVYTFVVKKQEEKAKTRWNLSDWLETRDKMRLMDLWLALHTPTPFEFYLGSDIQFGKSVSTSNYNMWKGNFAAFASIFGLEYQHEFNPYVQNLVMFKLRIFGYHEQSTHITLEGGLRFFGAPIVAHNVLAGATMSIYMNKFFGIEGLYRHYFDSAPTSYGVSIVGNRWEAGAFVDFNFVRIYGNYFTEPDNLLSTTGAAIGAKIFF